MNCAANGCKNQKPKCGRYCNPCRNLKQRYGLTVPDREKLLIEQNGKCKLCSKQIIFDGTAKQYSACIDHDHETGKVRGVLCGNCNTWLGYFENKKISFEEMQKYLHQ